MHRFRGLAASVKTLLLVVLVVLPVRAGSTAWSRYQTVREACLASGQDLLQQLQQPEVRAELQRRLRLLDGPPRIYPAFPLVPEPCDEGDSESSVVRDWGSRWAERFLQVADFAFKGGETSVCFESVVQALVVDPGNDVTRRALGFSCRNGLWLTPFQAYRRRLGLRWDPKWGWVNDEFVRRLQEGFRPVRNRWVRREESNRLLRAWSNARTLETDHYRVRSTASLEDTVVLATHLEQLYWVFSRLFADYLPPGDQLRLVFGRSRLAPLRRAGSSKRQVKFVVYCYRDAEQFRAAVSRFPVPGKDTATGLYVPRYKRVYCYVDESLEGGWIAASLHEATHQLVLEANSRARLAGTVGNYWVAEGVAAYMESLRLADGEIHLGSWDTPRLARARDRLVHERRFVPLRKFVAMSSDDFARGDAPFLYGQAALLTHFFLHGEDGKYRRPFLQYVREVFLGRATPDSLAEFTDTPYEQIEREFVVHVARQRW